MYVCRHTGLNTWALSYFYSFFFYVECHLMPLELTASHTSLLTRPLAKSDVFVSLILIIYSVRKLLIILKIHFQLNLVRFCFGVDLRAL